MQIIKGILLSFKYMQNSYALRVPTETVYVNNCFHVDGSDIIGYGDTEKDAKTDWQRRIHIMYRPGNLSQIKFLNDLLDLEYCLYANAKICTEFGTLIEDSKIQWSNNKIEEFDLIYPLNEPFKAEVVRCGSKIISLEAKSL